MARKWVPFTIVSEREAPGALAALRINKPKYSWRTKKGTGMSGMFAFMRIEKREK
jgi:hypothetical protein